MVYVRNVYDGKRSIYQNVQLFITSNIGILNLANLNKYSLRTFIETTLHCKSQSISERYSIIVIEHNSLKIYS